MTELLSNVARAYQMLIGYTLVMWGACALAWLLSLWAIKGLNPLFGSVKADVAFFTTLAVILGAVGWLVLAPL